MEEAEWSEVSVGRTKRQAKRQTKNGALCDASLCCEAFGRGGLCPLDRDWNTNTNTNTNTDTHETPALPRGGFVVWRAETER